MNLNESSMPTGDVTHSPETPRAKGYGRIPFGIPRPGGLSPPGTPSIAPAIRLPGSEFLIRLTPTSCRRLLYGFVRPTAVFPPRKDAAPPTSLIGDCCFFKAVLCLRAFSKWSINNSTQEVCVQIIKRKKKGLFVIHEMVNRMLTTRLRGTDDSSRREAELPKKTTTWRWESV